LTKHSTTLSTKSPLLLEWSREGLRKPSSEDFSNEASESIMKRTVFPNILRRSMREVTRSSRKTLLRKRHSSRRLGKHFNRRSERRSNTTLDKPLSSFFIEHEKRGATKRETAPTPSTPTSSTSPPPSTSPTPSPLQQAESQSSPKFLRSDLQEERTTKTSSTNLTTTPSTDPPSSSTTITPASIASTSSPTNASNSTSTSSNTNTPNKPSIGELVKKAEVVGNVFSRSTYGIDKIFITLRQGRKLPLGSYVFVLDDDGLPIVYQVASPEYYRYSYDFEKRLIAFGRAVKDDSYTYDCTGILVGKLYEDGRIEPPRYPVLPLAEVYLCTPELVKLITEPDEEPRVRIGINVLTKEPVYIKLRPLIRQGLLISGAQGTGKTTALLTLITRSLEAFDKLRFLILDWTGEFDALVSSEYAKRFRITSIAWDEFVANSKTENPELLLKLIISEDPRVQGAVYEVISSALAMCKKDGVYPTKDNLRLRIIGQLQQRKPETMQTALSVIERSTHIPRSPPKTIWTRQHFIEEIEKNNVVIIDFTKTNDPQTPDDMEVKMQVATSLANYIWEEATCRKDFGCIIVSDEAHRIAPEKAYSGIYGEREKINPIWIRLATEGGRKGCPLWFVARRLSLVSKAITTELQQNFICFNVEDVDRERVKQDIGETFASLLGALSPGEAIVKSATGFKIPGQVIHVKFDLVLQPSSVKYGLEERFKPLSPTTPTLPPSPNPTPELEPITDKLREPETQPKD
jgi:hypothetical protein